MKSQPLLFLNQLVFGCLEAYFQFKIGVKSGDTDLMMAGLIEGEKIFFFNRSNRNYQSAAAHRIADLIKMPDQMKILRLKNQTTDATVLNSFTLPSDNEGNFAHNNGGPLTLCLHMLDAVTFTPCQHFLCIILQGHLQTLHPIILKCLESAQIKCHKTNPIT